MTNVCHKREQAAVRISHYVSREKEGWGKGGGGRGGGENGFDAKKKLPDP